MVTCQSAQNTCKGFLSLQNGLSVWFTKRHNHGEDCWSDSCPEDNHWHPSQGGEATNIHYQRSCSQSAVSKHVNRKLSGRKKMHNQPREPQPYEDCQAKSIQEFGWTSQGMDWGWGQGIKSTTHRRVSRNLATVVVSGILPGLREEELDCCSVVLYFIWKFCISFGNQGPRVWRKGGEAHSPSCLKSSVKFHNLSWITEINELFHDIQIYWDALVFTSIESEQELSIHQ